MPKASGVSMNISPLMAGSEAQRHGLKTNTAATV